MAKLFFNYSSMNAGKTTILLQSAHNYRERGLTPLLFTPKLDDRYGEGWIKSRIGLQARATIFTSEDDLYEITRTHLEDRNIHCVLVDESQFLNRQQVYQLSEIVDRLNIPVLCFGLRTDFQGELFEGSKYLLAWADQLTEIKTICHTGKKANMVVRVDDEGYALKEGAQVEIGGNERYVSVSRAEFKKVFIGGERIKFIEPVKGDVEDEGASDNEEESDRLL
jgi:thymidine kinase